jgi:hypothetical protein
METAEGVGGNMQVGDLVTDADKDIGIVVGHRRMQGTLYNKVKWLTGNRSVSHPEYIETGFLEVICK